MDSSSYYKPSAPIEIPSRRKSSSPSPFFRTAKHFSKSPAELLFEMSPLYGEDSWSSRTKSFVHPSSLRSGAQNDSKSLSYVNRPSVRDAYFVQSSFIQRYHKHYNLHAPSPSSHPNRFATEKRYNLASPSAAQSPDYTELARTPPVIRTTAVHKISGFIPINPTSPENEHQERQPPHLLLTPSRSNSSFSFSPWNRPIVRDVYGQDNYEALQSPGRLDLEHYSHLDRRRIRPQRSTAQFSSTSSV